MKKQLNKLNKRLRITLSIMVLSLCTVFLFLSNSANAQITVTNVEGVNGDVTIPLATGQTNVYEISNVDQLRALSKYVAQNHTCSGLTFNLTADIDFTTLPAARNLVYNGGMFTSASNFVPIGSCSVYTYGSTNTYSYSYNTSYPSWYSFAGTFNGNNHTIKGLRIFADNNSDVGLFGRLKTSAGTPLKDIGIIDANIIGASSVGGLCGNVNLTNNNSSTSNAVLNIDNCYVKNSTIQGASGTCVGGLIGYSYFTSISNCYADKNIVGNNNNSIYYSGGLVGQLYYAKASNCYVKNSTVTGVDNVGGLCGYLYLNENDGAIDNCYVESTIVTSTHTQGSSSAYAGGFIGNLNCHNKPVTNCYVKSSTIQGPAGDSYGGFVGYIKEGSLFKNCYVTGTADNPTVIKGTTTPNAITKVGGFCGYFSGNYSYYVNIYNCYVTYTSVYGASSVGEFIGDRTNYTYSRNCYTTAAAYNGTTPTRVYNFYGTSSSSATNCYYDNGTATDGTAANGITGLSLATMKTNDFVNTRLNGTLPSGVTATAYVHDYTPFPVNGGYPIFNGTSAASLTIPYTVGKGDEIIIPEGTSASAIPSNITISDGGSLIDNSNNVSSVTIQKKMKVGAWNLFGLTQSTTTGVGILNSNAGTVSNTAHDMAAVQYDYTATGNTWNTGHYLGVNEAAGYNSMNIGEGYFVWPLRGTHDNPSATAGDANDLGDTYTIVSQTSAPYTSNITMTLTNNGAATTGNTVNGIWFSLNNPYTGKLSPSEICSGTRINNTQGENAVYTYNADNGAWEVPTYVYPGQGFMVASAENATTLSGTLTKATRTAKSSGTTPSYITFTCQANNTTKEAFARISEQASNGFDQKDAYVLLSSNNENLVEPYFLVENHAVLKNIYKTMPYYTPMNFHASKESNTNLTINNIPENVNVSIIDLSNGNETALENGSSFNFVANQGENEGRFVVKFGKNSVGIDNNAEENNISLAMYPNPATTQTTLFVDGLTNNAQVNICDVQGRIINTYTINNNQSTLKINTINLASGVYYIRVVSNNLTKTEKLIVK